MKLVNYNLKDIIVIQEKELGELTAREKDIIGQVLTFVGVDCNAFNRYNQVELCEKYQIEYEDGEAVEINFY